MSSIKNVLLSNETKYEQFLMQGLCHAYRKRNCTLGECGGGNIIQLTGFSLVEKGQLARVERDMEGATFRLTLEEKVLEAAKHTD